MTPRDLARLIDPEKQARAAGDGKLAVRCPAHEDKNPSLTVWIDKNGKAAFNCHAGCDHRDIVAALPDHARAEVESTWKAPEIRVLIPRRRYTPTEPVKPASSNIEAEYPYVTETGDLAYLVRRFTGKKIRQFHRENGRLISGRGDAALVPYRLPDVLEANRAGDTIYIVEGEKDADTLASAGLTATCNVGGAGKWTENLNGWFAGARIVILPDNDEPGLKHAQDVRNQLDGVAETVRILELPGLPDKGDVTDWLEDHEPEELEQLAHQPIEDDDDLPRPVDLEALMAGDPPETSWIIQPLIPAGRLTGLVASRGIGKSLLVLDVLARRAAGLPVFDHPVDQPIHVVYLDYEMGPEDLYDRLSDFGWTLDNPHFEAFIRHFHYYQLPDIPPLDTPEGGAAVEALAGRHDATLIVIDTLSRVISTGGENDAIPYQALYRHTEMKLKRQGRALIRIDHLGKDTSRGSRGSSAKEDALDVIWQMEIGTRSDSFTLTRTKGRIGDMPARLIVNRDDSGNTTRHDLEPLIIDRKIVDAAHLLDNQGFDPAASQNAHARALRAHGVKIRNSAVRKVVEYRRRRDAVTLEGDAK